MNVNQPLKIGIGLIFLATITITVANIGNMFDAPSTFEECAARSKSIIIETNPKKCVYDDKTVFTDPDQLENDEADPSVLGSEDIQDDSQAESGSVPEEELSCDGEAC